MRRSNLLCAGSQLHLPLARVPIRSPLPLSVIYAIQRTDHLAWVHGLGSLPVQELNVNVDHRTADDWC